MIILAVGAHYDDIEIGCGGTLLKHIDRGDEIFFGITSSDEHRTGDISVREQEQLASVKIMGLDINKIHRFSYHDEIHNIVGILDKIKPDVIFVHHEFDTHQDHRRSSIIGQAIGRKRETTTLFYDSGSSYDFSANVFSIIDFSKKHKLIECYKTQIDMGAVNVDIIKKKSSYSASLVSNEKDMFAEGFVVRKMRYEI